MAKNTTAEFNVAAAAQDEANLVNAVAEAGLPGRTPATVPEAARKVVNATSRIVARAADDELAKAAAAAAGATGSASHDRDRLAGHVAEGVDPVEAAGIAAGPRENTARLLVWYVLALNAAEAESTTEVDEDEDAAQAV